MTEAEKERAAVTQFYRDGVTQRRSVEAAAKRYAREHMVAVVMLANDDAVGYFYDVANDRVVSKIFRQPEWAA